MGTRSERTMRVLLHTKFCFLCVLTFLFHQCTHCYGQGHGHQHDGHEHDGHHHHHHVNHSHAHHGHNHSDLQISQAPYVRGASAPPESEGSHEHSPEEEQQYYIQQLFSRYGERGLLDYQGFQNLLSSLGLGTVKTVDVDHEDLGHDHVAHLDLLEVKEGLHSHSSSKEDHNHEHEHEHEHGHAHHKPGAQPPYKDQSPTACSRQSIGASPAAGHDHKLDQDHDAHGHDEKHGYDDGRGEAGDGAHVQDTHGHESEHKQAPPPHDHHDHNSSSEHQHDDVHGDGPTHLELPSSLPAPTAAAAAAATPPRKQRKSERVRGQRKRRGTTLSPTALPLDQEHGAALRDRREAVRGAVTPTLAPSDVLGHPGGMSHQHEECLNLTELLSHHGLSPDALISPNQFIYLCPALLYQIDSRVCIRHYHQMDMEKDKLQPHSPMIVWLSGFVSITIISLLSLLGVVLVPILRQSCFKFLLTFLVALAVGTLSGDALLHLLPHSQGHHDHSEGASSHSGDLATAFDGVWKGLTALAGIYLLFIIEHCIGMFKHYKDHEGRKKASMEGKVGRKLSDHKLNRRSDAEWLHLKPLTDDTYGGGASCDNGHNDTQLSKLETPDSPVKARAQEEEEGHHHHHHHHHHHQSPGGGRKQHGHGHSHGGNCHSDQEMKDAGIASIAWMVIMGDGMHNFSDGMAIGAAFSANLTGGISTSVAVFCHELPHELGDFAVLLKAGMSVKQAIIYNLLSALMAYVGMIIGTAVGQYTHNVTSWIFATTAGMFLYVALVDMLPEMLHGDSEDHKRCQVGHFVLQNLGMLTGFGIMLLIAIFEDQIVFEFSF
ncbi:zinc transporter ZIP10 isoform X2 [Nelusetta ayraudi]|uniref:zinc transporter ZIP10 isoform X2 n=1 Tax=Nelusetta ayraudi TaxID=303726 RepID=UPI003F71D579